MLFSEKSYFLRYFAKSIGATVFHFRYVFFWSKHNIFYFFVYFYAETATQRWLKKMCFENMQQIYRKTRMRKCDFNKVFLQLYWNHIWHRCFPVSLLRIFRILFPKNTSGGLLLSILNSVQLNFCFQKQKLSSSLVSHECSFELLIWLIG